MCRFIAYLGQPVVIDTLVSKTENSLLKQSIEAQESVISTNGDGFGVGWYNHDIDETPGLFTSILPAWNDSNLQSLCKNILAPCFFAHVRAANQGAVVQYNCHPFVYKNLLFMHNGIVSEFPKIKRFIQQELDDEIFGWLRGDTDSEHIFALILQYAKKQSSQPFSLATLTQALKQAVTHILSLISLHSSQSEPSFLNLCLTDGHQMICCRYTDATDEEARSLYCIQGTNLEIENATVKYAENTQQSNFVLISSEPLSSNGVSWHPIDNNQLLIIDKDLKITYIPLMDNTVTTSR